MTCNGKAVSKVIGWGVILKMIRGKSYHRKREYRLLLARQTEISGHCYGKNGELDVVDFGCAKCHCIGILHNLTDICRKGSAGFGLCVERVPVVYHRDIKHFKMELHERFDISDLGELTWLLGLKVE
jgi:hypothetical protein